MNPIIYGIARYVFVAAVVTVNHILILMGPGLLLAFLMNFVAMAVERLAYLAMGRSLFLALFGWLGTIVHELGHAFFNILFGHKITAINLFKPDAINGTLGGVEYAFDSNNIFHQIGRFFSSIGPIPFGAAVIYVASLLLVGPEALAPVNSIRVQGFSIDSLQEAGTLLGTVYQASLSVPSSLLRQDQLSRWQFWLFLYITFCVGSSITLSSKDLGGMWYGFFTLVVCFFVFNLATCWIGDFATAGFMYVSRFYGFFYTIMIFVIALNGAAAVILLPFAAIRRLLR